MDLNGFYVRKLKERDGLTEELAVLFVRLYREGIHRWRSVDIVATLHTPESFRALHDEDVQYALRTLEGVGLIQLVGRRDCYLEVLHD